MSVYKRRLKTGHSWAFTFLLKGGRYYQGGFKTKQEARDAEARLREGLKNPRPQEPEKTPITFGELSDRRMDYLQVHKTTRYYKDNQYVIRRVADWRDLPANHVTREMVEQHLSTRLRESTAYAANYDLRVLKALFGFGVKRDYLDKNPCQGIEPFPVEKKLKHLYSEEEIERILAVAEREERDYLLVLRDTMARVGEVNQLTWDDVHLAGPKPYLVLKTRKKKGSNLAPRKVPMTQTLRKTLSSQLRLRDPSIAWVFWRKVNGQPRPFSDRDKLFPNLCKKAGVRYVKGARYHSLRHLGASILAAEGAPITDIQRILGHERATTTDIYLQSLGESLTESIKKLERRHLRLERRDGTHG